MKPKTNRAGSTAKSSKFDRCQTPPYALGPLIPYLTADCCIWEPACGEGLLGLALERHGFTLIETDILTGYDFFKFEAVTHDVIVTNPPYSIKFAWLERCYQLGKPFALLVPVEMIGAGTAHKLFAEYGKPEIIFMDKRVDFKMPDKGWAGGGSQFPTMWLTHGLGIGAETTYAKLNKPNAQRRREMAAGVNQLDLFAGRVDA